MSWTIDQVQCQKQLEPMFATTCCTCPHSSPSTGLLMSAVRCLWHLRSLPGTTAQCPMRSFSCGRTKPAILKTWRHCRYASLSFSPAFGQKKSCSDAYCHTRVLLPFVVGYLVVWLCTECQRLQLAARMASYLKNIESCIMLCCISCLGMLASACRACVSLPVVFRICRKLAVLVSL